MSTYRRPSTLSRSHTATLGRVWWWARCLLVLILAFDHLSGPFHNHHHDDIAVQHELAASHAGLPGIDGHADGEEHPTWSHNTLTVRAEPSRSVHPLAIAWDAWQWMLLPSPVETIAAFDVRSPPLWHRDRLREHVLSYRSLPPAGRAPPLHA